MGNAFGGVSERRDSWRACRKAFLSECRSSRCAYRRAGGLGPKFDSNASVPASPTLPVCLPQVNLACLKLSLPDGGRRVRYGKLRSDLPRSLAAKDARPAKPELARPLAISSLPLAPPADKEAPFHPPGAPLPLGGRGEPCFRLLPAFGKSREDRFLPASPSRVSHGPCALARRAGSFLRALTPHAFSVPRVSGGSASGSCQRKRRLPARGLGASRRSVDGARRGELREVASGCKAPGRFWRRCKQCALPEASKVKGAVRLEDRHPPPAVRRGVMRKEKGGRRPRFKARTGLGGLRPKLDPNPQSSRQAA